MSLQNYDPNKPKKIVFTFQSLLNNFTALKKQVDKTKEVSEELDVIRDLNDVKKNTRVQKTNEDSRKKFAMYQEAYNNLKKEEPPNSLQPQIDTLIEQTKRILDSLTRSLSVINNRCKIREEEINKEIAEQQAQEAEQRKKSLEQMQEEQMAADNEHTAKEMQEIMEQATVLNETTHEVDDKLTEQHDVVVKINDTIEEAKEEMIAGNKDLEEAEEDQKAGSLIKTPGLPCCSIC